jgi:hypothetical protein
LKEILAAFAAEIFRPVVTLLIPGFWSLVPWLVMMFLRDHIVWQFVLDHRTPSALVFLAAATAVGMILENLGGELENFFFYKHGNNASENWYDYLALALEPQPIAFSYIRSYVLRMKFEGGMCAGGVSAIIGIAFLPIDCCLKVCFLAIAILLTIYLVFQVKSSVKELVNVRQELLNRLRP